jgi:hypothetical protein
MLNTMNTLFLCINYLGFQLILEPLAMLKRQDELRERRSCTKSVYWNEGTPAYRRCKSIVQQYLPSLALGAFQWLPAVVLNCRAA